MYASALARQDVHAFFEVGMTVRIARAFRRARQSGFPQAAASSRPSRLQPRLFRVTCAQADSGPWRRLDELCVTISISRLSSRRPAGVSLRRHHAGLHQGLERCRRLGRDCIRDIVSACAALFRQSLVRAAIPSGWRDRSDVGQHRLVTASATQLVHQQAVLMIRRIVNAIEVHEVRLVCEHASASISPPCVRPPHSCPQSSAAT